MDILKQGVSYDFRVIGVNDYGYGTPSPNSPSISGELSCVCRSVVQPSQKLIFNIQEFLNFLFLFHPSPKSGAVLRGVVVPGRGGAGRAHLHPAAGFHPHHQRTEQEVRQEVGIR